MELKINLIIYTVAVVAIILGILLVILKKSSSYIQGPEFWAAGSFLLGLSSFCFASFPWPTEYVNLLSFNILIIASISMFLTGILKFKGKPPQFKLIIGLILFSVMQTTVFSLVIYKPGIRLIINSLIYAFFLFYSAVEFFFPQKKELTAISRITSLVFFIYGLFIISRALIPFQTTHIDLLEKNILNILIFIIATLLQGILTYGFIIMVNTQVACDLNQQLLLRDKFLSIIAHDLRSQINVISGFSELLNANTSENSNNKNIQYTNYIRQASKQTNALLNNLLDWAKIQSKNEIFNPEKLDLKELIEEEIELNRSIAGNKQIDISTQIEPTTLPLFADKNMLRTVIRNLLINAIKFTNSQGTIVILSKNYKSFIQIEVTDSGIGIDSESIGHLFKTGIQVSSDGTHKEPGSGLGLLLCKEFIEKHQGEIWVESEFEKGSSFKFKLPYGKESLISKSVS